MCKNHSFSKVFLRFLHIASLSHEPKNYIKSLLEPADQSFSQNSCSNLVSWLAGIDSRRVGASFGRLLSVSWPAFGRPWPALGPFRAPLGRFLGALGALLGALGCPFSAPGASLGRSWSVWWPSWAHFGSQERPRPRFWRGQGRAGRGFGKLQGNVLACLFLRLALRYVML